MYYHVDEPQRHYTNWNQPVTKGQNTKKNKNKNKKKLKLVVYLLERGVKV